MTQARALVWVGVLEELFAGEELENIWVVDPALAPPSSDSPKMCLGNNSPIIKRVSIPDCPFWV